jgi:UDP-3-O-[3-hydroxymyristoyl] glucosamine N-acyltransferase
MTDIPDKTTWLGAPAQPDREMKRQFIALQRLPDLLKKIAAWEKKLGGTE